MYPEKSLNNWIFNHPKMIYLQRIYGLALGLILLCQPISGFADGVKTYYKQYSIFTFENEEFLCEPYLVQKNDWLYKIFRQKGEISASDFSKFLRIFKKINPKLSNIDAIAPGHQILIPLKRIEKQAYQQKEEGVVEVPVLEFSIKFEEKNLTDYIRQHTIQSGDTVSTLLGKEFLKKGGAVSEAGKKTFTLLNPNIQDINRIYLGSQVLVPAPEILSQPWFETFLAQGTHRSGQSKSSQDKANVPEQPQEKRFQAMPQPVLSPRDLSRLKRYARLIEGTLMHQGKMYFPGKKGQPAKALDLSRTPLLEENDGKKTLVLPPDTPASDFDQDLLRAMKDYWKEIQLEELNKALTRSSLFTRKRLSLDEVPKSQNALIGKLISITPYTYKPNEKIPIVQNKIKMTIIMGRIIHPNEPDRLVNTGDVYGQALETIKTQGYDILNLSPDMSIGETSLLLFSKLGYDTWKNPAINENSKVETLYGLYVSRGMEKYFIVRAQPSERANDFLTREGIEVLIIKEMP